MRELPILFSAPMVRAILSGRKTQTRRVVKLPNNNSLGEWEPTTVGGSDARGIKHDEQAAIWHRRTGDCVCCPHGLPGDRLWVRETFSGPHYRTGEPPRLWHRLDDIHYWADGNPEAGDWTRPLPSIHMPRWASRLTLEITGVRVERLQDISEDDAAAEGVESVDSRDHEDRDGGNFDRTLCGNCGGLRLYASLGPNLGVQFDTDCSECDTHAKRFRWLWEGINGSDSWRANPWAWVVEFKRAEVSRG